MKLVYSKRKEIVTVSDSQIDENSSEQRSPDMAKAYWRCITCESFVLSDGKPDRKGCGNGYSDHAWYHYVDHGSDLYVCYSCGFKLNAAAKPSVLYGCNGAKRDAHNFTKK